MQYERLSQQHLVFLYSVPAEQHCATEGFCVVVVMELVGLRYRTILGTLIMTAFSVGYMLQPCLAFFLRDATWYQLVSTAISFLYPLVTLYVLVQIRMDWIRLDSLNPLVPELFRDLPSK